MTTEAMTPEEDRRYMSRKFLFAVSSWIAGTLMWAVGMFTAFEIMTTEQWILFTQWIVGLYLAGNVGDTLVTGLANIFQVRQ
jgi:hypothetical protein